MKRTSVLLILILLVCSTVSADTSVGSLVYFPIIQKPFIPLVLNPSFEYGDPPGDCIIWHNGQREPQTWCNDEQDVPTSWTLVTYNEYPCPCQDGPMPCQDDFKTRLPEIRLMDRWTYPHLVCDQDYSVMGFTYWGCVHYQLTQTIDVELHGTLKASADFMTWGKGQQLVRICLGDFCSDWSGSVQTCGRIETPPVLYSGSQLTELKTELRLECWSAWPWKNNNCLFDGVTVETVERIGDARTE